MAGRATHQIAVLGAIGAHTATMDDLAARLPIDRKNISTAAGKLIRRELAERLETGVYRLTNAGVKVLTDGAALHSGPYRGQRRPRSYCVTLQQRAWAAMRLTKRFSMDDLTTLAVNAKDKNPKAALQQFLRRLRLAQYIAELPVRRDGEKPTSNGFKQWRLIRDTGLLAPRWLDRERAFRDLNNQEVYPCV